MAESTKFTIDARQAFSELDSIDKALAELETRFRRLPGAIREGFRSNLSGQFEKNVDEARRSAEGLKKELEQIPPKSTAAFNPTQAERYAKAVGSAERAVDAIGDAKGPANVNRELGTSAALFRGLIGTAAAVGASLQFGDAIRQGIELNIEYERVKTSLTTILKSSEKAEALLGRLNQFAAETPFQSEQINQAATALLAFGESETTIIDRLREIGTLSAATGKDFNELATIYGKARVAGVLYAEDINQLVEAGIPIIGEFAKQLGVSEAQVKKLASQGKIGFSQLQTAFRNLTGEGGRFAGLLEAQGETLGGQISTLKDNAAQTLRLLTSYLGLTTVVERLTQNFGRLFSSIAKDLAPAQKTQIQQTRETQAQFNLEVEALKRSNFTQKERVRAIGEINTKYREYLPNLISEKASIEDIARAQEIANNQFEQKILFLAFEQEYQKEVERSKRAVESAYQAERNRTIVQERLRRDGAQDNARFEQSQQALAGLLGTIREEALQTAQEAPENLRQVEESFEALAQRLGTSLSAIRERFRQAQETGGGGDQEGAGGKAGKTAADLEFERREKDLAKRRLLLNDLEDGLEKELETIRLHFEQLRLEYDRAGLDTAGLIEKQAAAEISATVNFLSATAEAENERLRRAKEAGQKYIDARREQLDQEKAARDSVIDLAEERGNQLVLVAERAGAKEGEVEELRRQFQLATQKARLESEIKFQESLLALTAQGNAEQAAQIKRTIDLLKAQLAGINIEIETPVPKTPGGKKGGLLDFLGIELSDQEAAAVKQGIDAIIGSINDLQSAQLEAAKVALDTANQRVDSAERALEQELQLAEAGFASNVTLRQKELAEAKKVREQALRDQQRAARAQIAVDTAVQSASIITASANIFKTFSALPFGAGIPIAVAIIAAMIGSFIAAKARAIQATRARYGKSGFLTREGIVDGRTHAQGGEVLEVERGEIVQVADDGSRRRIEVVRRERAREYMDLLRAANKGDRREIARQAFLLAGLDSMADRPELNRGETIRVQAAAMPTIQQEQVKKMVFGKEKQSVVNVTVSGGDTERTNHLLESLLAEMQAEHRRERWTPDGRTKIHGSIKTRYVG